MDRTAGTLRRPSSHRVRHLPKVPDREVAPSRRRVRHPRPGEDRHRSRVLGHRHARHRVARPARLVRRRDRRRSAHRHRRVSRVLRVSRHLRDRRREHLSRDRHRRDRLSLARHRRPTVGPVSRVPQTPTAVAPPTASRRRVRDRPVPHRRRVPPMTLLRPPRGQPSRRLRHRPRRYRLSAETARRAVPALRPGSAAPASVRHSRGPTTVSSPRTNLRRTCPGAAPHCRQQVSSIVRQRQLQPPRQRRASVNRASVNRASVNRVRTRPNDARQRGRRRP